jgi:hypothetical protein
MDLIYAKRRLAFITLLLQCISYSHQKQRAVNRIDYRPAVFPCTLKPEASGGQAVHLGTAKTRKLEAPEAPSPRVVDATRWWAPIIVYWIHLMRLCRPTCSPLPCADYARHERGAEHWEPS